MFSTVLLVDIGNTFLKGALADASGLVTTFRSPSSDITAASFASIVREQLQKTAMSAPKQALLCSVVPKATAIVSHALRSLGITQLFLVPEDLSIPLKNTYLTPETLGHDRLLGCYAARMLYPKQPRILVVDLGTAITIDLLEEETFMGGFILPGPNLCLRALGEQTAQLPIVSFEQGSSLTSPGRTTAQCIQKGVLLGVSNLLKGMLQEIAQQFSTRPFVLATGGAAPLFCSCSSFQAVCPTLLLEGLYHLATKHL